MPPGITARPFTDFRDEINKLPPGQQGRLVGRGNLQLIESGKVRWEDVVTRGRIRTLGEVVQRGKLTRDDLIGAGLSGPRADAALGATRAAGPANAAKRAAIEKLRSLGLTDAQITQAIKDRLRARLGIGKGPSGGSPSPKPKSPPKPPRPKPPAPMAAVGVGGLADGVRFVLPEGATGLVAVPADLARLDAALARDAGFHVGAGGTGAAIPGRYAEALAFLARAQAEGLAVAMGRVGVDAAGEPYVSDGRHRLAAFKDSGATIVPVAVPKGEAARFRRLYGVADALARVARHLGLDLSGTP